MNKVFTRDGILGVLLIAVFAVVAWNLAQLEIFKSISLSPLIIGILLGMVYANTFRKKLPGSWVPGILFCTKQILRAGIVLYGFRLTFQHIMDVGAVALLIDAIIVTGTILLGVGLGRVLKMDKDTALLTSVGSSICGAAAVLGAEPVVKSEPYKAAVAVSTVVIFGTLSMFLYPTLYRAGVYEMDVQQLGLYTGATLHEVAHVVGAGNAMSAEIADNAIIVKMIRVILLAPALLVIGLVSARGRGGRESGYQAIVIPWFAVLFLVVIGFNSIGLLSTSAIDVINELDTFMLTMAMTALGAETSFDKFKQAGVKPFVLAGLLYVWLVFGGYGLVKLLVNQ